MSLDFLWNEIICCKPWFADSGTENLIRHSVAQILNVRVLEINNFRKQKFIRNELSFEGGTWYMAMTPEDLKNYDWMC